MSWGVAVNDERKEEKYDKNELMPMHSVSPAKRTADTNDSRTCTPLLVGPCIEDSGTKTRTMRSIEPSGQSRAPFPDVALHAYSQRAALRYAPAIPGQPGAPCGHRGRQHRPVRDSNSATLDRESRQQREGPQQELRQLRP